MAKVRTDALGAMSDEFGWIGGGNLLQMKLRGLARIFHAFEMFIGKAQGCRCTPVPQASDNAANEHLGRARRVKL